MDQAGFLVAGDGLLVAAPCGVKSRDGPRPATTPEIAVQAGGTGRVLPAQVRLDGLAQVLVG